MFTFNEWLEKAGLDLKKVKLVRHQDTCGKDRRFRPYFLWQAGDGRFETYQSIQSRLPFKRADHIASFVVSPAGETIFVGLWDVAPEVDIAPPEALDPVTRSDISGLNKYQLMPNTTLNKYSGRLIIDWGDGTRSWCQWAKGDALPKPILELRGAVHEEKFPGLMAFRHWISELDTMPESWRGFLSDVQGVYLLACRITGKAYVGSAYGNGGFLARWEEYASSGHGGNIGMLAHPHSDWQVSILEVAASSATALEIIGMETVWKAKLLSLEFGLNKN